MLHDNCWQLGNWHPLLILAQIYKSLKIWSEQRQTPRSKQQHREHKWNSGTRLAVSWLPPLLWSLREKDWKVKEVTGGFETRLWKNFLGLFTVRLLFYSAFFAFRFLVPSFSSSFDFAGGGGGWEASWEAPWWSWWWLLCPLETEPKKTGQRKLSTGAKGEAWEWVAVIKTCRATGNT